MRKFFRRSKESKPEKPPKKTPPSAEPPATQLILARSMPPQHQRDPYVESLVKAVESLLSVMSAGKGSPVRPLEINAVNAEESLIPGDLVQLLPSTDHVFGGMLFRVCKSSAYGVKGFLLVPHRGGCREAWHSYTPGQVRKIGHLHWPESEFGFTKADEAMRRRMWTDPIWPGDMVRDFLNHDE